MTDDQIRPSPLTFDDVSQTALALPGATEGTRYRHRSWDVGGKVFAWERPYSKADRRRAGADPLPEGLILAVSVADLADKEAVIEAHDAVFTIPHLDGYAAVLVQLDACPPDLLGELLEDAWLSQAPRALVQEFLGDPRT